MGIFECSDEPLSGLKFQTRRLFFSYEYFNRFLRDPNLWSKVVGRGSSVVSSAYPALKMLAKTITTENRDRICNILSVRIFYDSKFKLFKSYLPIASSRLGAMWHKWCCGNCRAKTGDQGGKGPANFFLWKQIGSYGKILKVMTHELMFLPPANNWEQPISCDVLQRKNVLKMGKKLFDYFLEILNVNNSNIAIKW